MSDGTGATAPTNDPTTYKGPLPGAGSYGILQGSVENAYGQALTTINTNRNNFLRNSGVSGTYDGTTGNFTGAGDPLASGQGSYWDMTNANAGQGAADEAAINTMGFGGGLKRQQQEAAQKGYSQNATNWANNELGQLNQFGQQDVQATQTAGDSLYNGLVSNITDAITAGNFNPANFTNVSIPGYGDLTQDDIKTLGTSLGWKGGTTAPGTPTGVGPGSPGVPGTNLGHPGSARYAYNMAHPNHQMNMAQWVAAGRPK